MAELSEAKRQLLAQRLGARASAVRAPEPIPARLDGPPPLSAGQSALLYEYRLRPDQAIYNVVFAYRMLGPLAVDRFREAILTAVARHEPLLTSFDADRRVLSVAEAAQIVEVTLDDVAFDKLAGEEALRRFDLENGPLMRVTIARMGRDRHGLILAVHHVSSDAASLSNLWREIDLAYHGEPVPELQSTYSSHAVWQSDRNTQADIDFWFDHLGPDACSVELPLEAPTPPESDGYLTVPLGVSRAALDETGARSTPFFLAVLAALLQRYTDTDDVVVGATASNRDHPAVEDLVGYFLTVLPLRLPIDPGSSPAATARSVEELLASALRHRHVPYAAIASERRRRDAEQPDPARVMFVYDDPHQAAIRGIDIEGHIVHPEVAVTDLTLFVRPVGSGFEVSVEWDGRRYRAADIAGLAAEFVRMAEWAVAHPGSPWSALPQAPDLEGAPLAGELVPLPTLIEKQALATPDAPAVRCADERLTYRELWHRASEISAGLVERGVGRGDSVAILLPRSVDAIAVILGVQRLGAAYVPIDPTYPADRIDLILAEAGVQVTVTDTATASRLTHNSISVDELLTAAGPVPHTRLELDDPAYVIFTSGSTGTPRGVLVDHRRLAASTLARLERYEEPVGKYLMPSSLGFDSSVAGLYWTLATGGELIVPSEVEVHDVDALGQLIAAAEATHTLMVPSLYRALLQRDASLLETLRCAIVAGEAAPSSLVELHHDRLPATTLTNEYGPTEATVWATAHRCSPGDAPVPIGGPVPGVQLRVVDRWLRPRPTGAAGQLAIAGAGVTDGYLGRPELTDRSFVQDASLGDRWYLSGDLVRINANEELLFLGRLDHQVSVGGTRIEPEEIESRLLGMSGVRAAIVRVERQLRTDPLDAIAGLSRDKAAEVLRVASSATDPAAELAAQLSAEAEGADVLVAYVEGADLDGADLRAWLGETLPHAMVPTVIEVVDQLARTDHGKVDRSALPPPLRLPRQQTAVAPRSDLVGHLVEAFANVLDRPDLEADSDFFASGGDSLHAVEVVTLLEERLGRRIPISALVLGRTPRELAALIATPTIDAPVTEGGRQSYVVPIRPGGDRSPLLIMPPGGGNLIVFDPLVQALDDRYPIIGFDLPGASFEEDLPTSVESLCDTYLPQLRAAVPHGPYRFLGWSFGGVVALELADRLTAEGEDVDLVALIDTLVPGMQRADRHRAYIELARNGDVAGIGAKFLQFFRGRVRKIGTIRRGKQALATGGSLATTDRNNWLLIKVDQFVERYRAKRYEGKVVFFAAQNTPTWRTTEPWRELLPDLDIVPLDGTHDGSEGLLSGERAVRIAAEIAERLG